MLFQNLGGHRSAEFLSIYFSECWTNVEVVFAVAGLMHAYRNVYVRNAGGRFRQWEDAWLWWWAEPKLEEQSVTQPQILSRCDPPSLWKCVLHSTHTFDTFLWLIRVSRGRSALTTCRQGALDRTPHCRWSNDVGVRLVKLISQTLHTEGPPERQQSLGAAKRCYVIDDCCLLRLPIMRLHLYQNTMTDDSQQRKGHSVWLSAQQDHIFFTFLFLIYENNEEKIPAPSPSPRPHLALNIYNPDGEENAKTEKTELANRVWQRGTVEAWVTFKGGECVCVCVRACRWQNLLTLQMWYTRNNPTDSTENHFNSSLVPRHPHAVPA